MGIDGLDGLTQFGMMNKISTGYSALDLLLCLCLPGLLQYVTRLLNDRVLDEVSLGGWRKYFWGRTCVRRVVHERTHSWWSSDGQDGVHNHILQRAILLYINSIETVTQQFTDGNLFLHEPVTESGSSNSDTDLDGDDDVCDTSKRLQSYTVVSSPPTDQWVTIQKLPNGDVLEFRRYEIEAEGSSGGSSTSPPRTTVEFTIRAKTRRSDPEVLVQQFMSGAFEYYQDLARSKGNSKCRYFYSPINSNTRKGPASSGGEDGGGSGAMQLYKCYPLSEEKTFENGFFHPDKKSVISLVDNFTNRTGKFAVPGYPHKLGLLLHGPPGTGKTSLIKALAQYTGRHIVSVPLNKVDTNQDLMDIMFDREYKVAGQDFPVKLPFTKTIFVMEDVDAACSVVQRRGEYDGNATRNPVDKEVLSAVVGRVDKTRRTLHKTNDYTSPFDVGAPFPTVDREASSVKRAFDLEKDKLNLAGLLNVLDGVLDCPGRIVVMTSNHPETLDPALIRPGRVNRKVFMGYLQPEEAVQMVRHYFGPISPPEEAELRSSVAACQVTPATLEMFCGEHEQVGGLVSALLAEAAPDQDSDTANKANAGIKKTQEARRKQRFGMSEVDSAQPTSLNCASFDSACASISNKVTCRAESSPLVLL